MIHRKNYVFTTIEATGLLGKGVLPLALLCLLPLSSAVICAAESAQPAARKVIKLGDTFPIYLHPQVLAEANQPSLDIVEGASFWNPGPERFYGWAVRDLRDYLQKASKAQYPLRPTDGNARSGLFAGTFAQFPSFKPQQASAKQAMASTDPEAFAVEAQGDKLFILGKSNLGLMAAIYSLLDKLGCKWFAPGQQWENVPQLNGLVLDNKLNLASAGPSFKWRAYFSTYGPNARMEQPGEPAQQPIAQRVKVVEVSLNQ